jgi:hypothetical protein
VTPTATPDQAEPVTVRYAIRCGTCRTAAPLVGQLLAALSAQVTDFMAEHPHVNPDFAVVRVPSAVTTVMVAAVQTIAEPLRADVA